MCIWLKRNLFLFICCLLAPGLWAQTGKGNYQIGGGADASLSFNSTTRSFNVSLQPSFSAFVVNNFAVGVLYAFGISGSHSYNTATPPVARETNNFNTSLGPSLKYYIGKNKGLKGVISANASFALTTGVRTETNRNPGTTYQGFVLGGLAGLAYFFNEHLSLEPCLYISTSGYQTLIPSTRVGFSVGLYTFIDKKKPVSVIKTP